MTRLLLVIAALLFAAAIPAAADTTSELEALLNDFLANVDTRDAHDRMWAEDLVYTSSSGLRFGKATIMESYADGAATEPATVRYSAEDVQIKDLGDVAVVTFKLVSTPVDGESKEPVRHFLNTGTFVRRGGEWQAVAWQATQAAE